MLAKEFILKRRKDIELVMKKGYIHQTPLFGILVYDGKEVVDKRFGFIISKKISKRAVDRNRIKRLLTEAVRKNIDKFEDKKWVVFLAKKSLLGLKYEEVEREITRFRI